MRRAEKPALTFRLEFFSRIWNIRPQIKPIYLKKYYTLDVGPVVDGRIDMKSIKTKTVSVGTTVKV